MKTKTKEKFQHDVCPKCKTASVPAEWVPDQSFRGCPKCLHTWTEDLSRSAKTSAVTFNKESQLFIIPECGGFSCLGFDVCRNKAAKLAAELGGITEAEYRAKQFPSALAVYADYERLVEIARAKNKATGWRSQSELTPELIGKEGRRVEVVHQWKPDGMIETVRFKVGKSTGFIPCHLELKNSRSSGGGAVCLGKIKSVRVIK